MLSGPPTTAESTASTAPCTDSHHGHADRHRGQASDPSFSRVHDPRGVSTPLPFHSWHWLYSSVGSSGETKTGGRKRAIGLRGDRSARSRMFQVSSSGKMAALKALILVAALHVLSTPVWSYGITPLSSGQLSCGDKQMILSMHNQMRSRVALGQVHGQPPAANMREMVWDDNLARIAQSWANRGSVTHNSPGSGVGENIAATWTYGHPSPSGPSPDFRKCISDWFGEVSYFSSHNVRSYQFSHSTGHYSQLAWGDTYRVGCGYNYYIDPQKGHTKFYVCNYGPAGNIIGGQLYHIGSPSCSSFGLYPSRRYSGLCEVPGSNPPGSVCSAASTGHYPARTQAYYPARSQAYYPRPYYYGR